MGPCIHGVVTRMRKAVEALVHDLHRAHGFRYPLELVAAISRPLPREVVLAALGISRGARPAFGDDVTAFLRHLSDPTVDEVAALARLRGAIRGARSGILAELARQAPAIDEDDALANAILIVSAGHRTTENLLGSLLHAILTNEPALALLLEDPTRIAGAVEETLRMESPIQSLQRTATSPTTVGGAEIAAGQSVPLVLGAANRDPAEFPDAARFDPRRSPNRHLAFGFGAHFCLGAALARMQAAVVLESLLPRLPRMRVVSAVFREDAESRGLSELIVDEA
jgi:pimeloyl-[acyl-carrier protein] synthase